MKEGNRERLNDFLRSLREALAGSVGHSGQIVEEVAADLESHVNRFQAEGRSEDEAVAAAISEMGNPYELAHGMGRELPPFGGRALTMLRYGAAVGLILWTLLLLWNLRAWVYGFSPLVVAIVVLLHVPAILLLWPRIVWRKNWLFGLAPAALGMGFVLLMAFGGVGQEASGSILPPDGESPAPIPPAESPAVVNPIRTAGFVLGAGAVMAMLLLAMQRRSQRRWVALILLLVVAIVEALFQGEEVLFRQDQQRVRHYVEATYRETGVLPSSEVLRAEGPKLRNGSVTLVSDGKDFSLFWDRPLCPGFAIVSSSRDGQIRIQD